MASDELEIGLVFAVVAICIILGIVYQCRRQREEAVAVPPAFDDIEKPVPASLSLSVSMQRQSQLEQQVKVLEATLRKKQKDLIRHKTMHQRLARSLTLNQGDVEMKQDETGRAAPPARASRRSTMPTRSRRHTDRDAHRTHADTRGSLARGGGTRRSRRHSSRRRKDSSSLKFNRTTGYSKPAHVPSQEFVVDPDALAGGPSAGAHGPAARAKDTPQPLFAKRANLT